MTTNRAAHTIMPGWAHDGHRIDPRALDRRRVFVAGGMRFALDARGATVTGPDGIAAALPPKAFVGIAARAVENDEGVVTVTLELMHADAALSVPLLVAHDLDHVAADWRDWARLFDLPMLMVEADGSVSTLDEGVPRSQPRRRRAMANRPRFLCRRLTGSMGVAMRIEGREIVARR